MPPVIKYVTIFQSDNGYGWTEVHWKQAQSENPQLDVALNNFVNGVVIPRSLLLGADCSVVGVRVSYPKAIGIASNSVRQEFPGEPTQPSSEPDTAIGVTFKDASFTKSKITFLRGFWDIVEQSGSFHPELGPGWGPRFIAWKQGLIDGGYGWLSKDAASSSRGDVTNYVIGEDGNVTFTVAPTVNALPAPLSVISVRFSRLNNSKSTLNRALIVEVVNATTLRTVEPIAAFDFTGKGKFNYRATSFIGYNQTSTLELAERSMGRPLNRSPGRYPDRARG